MRMASRMKSEICRRSWSPPWSWWPTSRASWQSSKNRSVQPLQPRIPPAITRRLMTDPEITHSWVMMCVTLAMDWRALLTYPFGSTDRFQLFTRCFQSLLEMQFQSGYEIAMQREMVSSYGCKSITPIWGDTTLAQTNVNHGITAMFQINKTASCFILVDERGFNNHFLSETLPWCA